MKVKLPKAIKVASHPYAIKFDPDIEDHGHDGEVNHRLQEISIKPGYKPDKLMEILLHELFHCINYVYCQNSLSEAQVDGLGEGWAQVLGELDVEFDWSDIEE